MFIYLQFQFSKCGPRFPPFFSTVKFCLVFHVSYFFLSLSHTSSLVSLFLFPLNSLSLPPYLYLSLSPLLTHFPYHSPAYFSPSFTSSSSSSSLFFHFFLYFLHNMFSTLLFLLEPLTSASFLSQK